ncbi:MAG: hypothetical protein Q9195_005788 [Heterodermia aff. obscurata]
MTANVRCMPSHLELSPLTKGPILIRVIGPQCASWDGGSMSFTSSSSQWIWAVKSGSAVKSDSVSAQLAQHEGQGSFKLDLTQARGGDSVNPFVETGSTSTGTSGSSSSSSSGSSSDGSSGSSSGSSSGGSTGGADDFEQLAKDFAKRNKAVIAHGVIMGLAFALLFPSGAIMIRLFSFTGLVWVHAGAQMLAYALAIAGMGYHPIIGLVVVSLLAFQPILGMVHHIIYKKRLSRTAWATAHVWYGRVLLTLGIINGGLGLRLSDNTKGGEIAYGVIAGLLWLLWMVVVVFSYANRGSSGPNAGETGERLTGGYTRNNGSSSRSQYSSSQEITDRFVQHS